MKEYGAESLLAVRDPARTGATLYAATGFPEGSVRRAGGGRHRLTTTNPTLLEDLRRLLEPATMGDPMRPLLWVSKSHAKLADALCAMGHPISPNTVGKLLREELGYSRQTNRKTLEGARHPDRDDAENSPSKKRTEHG